jgi:peptidoglycan/LPS O-acetylase OafA/YrhL
MAVVLQHFAATFQQYCSGNLPSPVPHGYMAVDFFFVLSGFIMCYTYLGDFQARGMAAYTPFLAKRFGRIFPLHAFCVLAMLLLGAVSVALLGRNLFHASTNLLFDVPANLLMLQGIGIGQNMNGPSWSVSVEFVAYVLFPLLIAVVFRNRLLPWIAALLGAAGLVQVAGLDPRWSLSAIDPLSATIRCLAGFTFGMIGYRLYAETRLGALLGRSPVAVLLAAAVGLALVLKQGLVAAALFAPLVIAFAVNQGLPARLLGWRPLHFLGVISFSLYLVHEAFRPIALLALQRLVPHPVGVPVAFGLTLVCSLLVIPFAWATYAAVERPGRAYLRTAIDGVTRVAGARAGRS